MKKIIKKIALFVGCGTCILMTMSTKLRARETASNSRADKQEANKTEIKNSRRAAIRLSGDLSYLQDIDKLYEL